MEIFWRTIAYYNSATWLLQIVIILIGIALTGLLIGRPRPWVKMAMKFYMISFGYGMRLRDILPLNVPTNMIYCLMCC